MMTSLIVFGLAVRSGGRHGAIISLGNNRARRIRDPDLRRSCPALSTRRSDSARSRSLFRDV
jgi:hypothetical protein